MRPIPLALALALVIAAFPSEGQARGAAKKPAAAPAPSAAPTPLKAVLVEINDRRAESFPALTLTLSLPDFTAAEVGGQRVVVREAVDDTGASLVPEGAADARFEANEAPPTRKSAASEPATIQLKLKSPSRSAKTLKTLSGEVELYVPGRDPTSSATIAKFASKVDQPLSDPALAANGVKVTVVSAKSLAARKKAAGEEARKKALKDGWDADMVKSEAESAEKQFLWNYDARYQTLLKVSDPKERVASYAYVDPQGKEAPVRDMEMEGYTLLTHGTDAPGADWGLRVRLKTQKSQFRHSIALKDVPLP